MKVHELIIIGGGPAGYTAALYASRGNLAPLQFEGFERGGQLMITTDVDNYPGFPEGIMGPELMIKFREQAARFGAQLVSDDVTRVEFSDDPINRPHRIFLGDEEHQAHAVIIATGATARQLGLESERKLQGRGVSYCATCDAAFFRAKRVVVVGGGDSAMEEATFLAKFADEVVIVHRRAQLRASKVMQDRAHKNPKISWELGYEVETVIGDNTLDTVRIRNVDTAETKDLPADGLFVAIGHDPTTSLFVGQIDMDENGYIIQRPGSTATNAPGVFAAGDVADHVYRQAVTAAGSGCEAALDAERWLTNAREAAAKSGAAV
ncbi:MAG: thioredoxin reductase [Gaiellaceae bacterium]|nr:thioredoxin reductase [Gaiellaceae bacterium]